jgi:hypothetical protein
MVALAAYAWRVIGPSLSSITRPHWGWLPIALVAEAISMGASARMQRHTLAQGGITLPRDEAASLVYAGNALSVSVPVVGGTASLAFLAREYARRGASAALVSWTLAITGLASAATLALVIGVGGLFSGDGWSAVAAAIATGAGLVPIVVLFVLLRGAAGRRLLARVIVTGLAISRRIMRRSGDLTAEVATETVSQLAAFRLRRGPAAAILGFALVNWLADVVCLAAAIAFVGAAVPWPYLALVYAAGVAAATIGLTPAGIGIVERAIADALLTAGLPAAAALPAAIVYRAISCWLVLAVGWLVLAAVRSREPRDRWAADFGALASVPSLAARPQCFGAPPWFGPVARPSVPSDSVCLCAGVDRRLGLAQRAGECGRRVGNFRRLTSP